MWWLQAAPPPTLAPPPSPQDKKTHSFWQLQRRCHEINKFYTPVNLSELAGSSGQAGGGTALAVRGPREAIEDPRRGQPPAAGNHLHRPATRAAIHEGEETTVACV